MTKLLLGWKVPLMVISLGSLLFFLALGLCGIGTTGGASPHNFRDFLSSAGVYCFLGAIVIFVCGFVWLIIVMLVKLVKVFL